MAKALSMSGKDLTVSVTVRLEGTRLELEEAIRQAANEVGCCATEEALKRFDTDGSAIRIGALKLTARERVADAARLSYCSSLSQSMREDA